ncbi:MAG TPA: hypothetical protein VE078_15800 [Thermoanaerobaculia bacterium]|nr:hypothetical protein [Thermoanaerobaculia bacterium]
MNRPVVAAIVMLALPAVVFSGGAWIMDKMSGRTDVPQPPINRRFHYDTHDVQQYWKAFKDVGTEKRFLELDLVFPFLYCGALAASLLMAWASLGRTFNPAWILAPLVITLLADWTENLTQLKQLQRFLDGLALQENWIRIASTATALKLSFFYASWLLLFFLVGRVLWRAFRGI